MLLKVEWKKLYKQKNFKVLFVLFGIVLLGISLLYSLGETQLGLNIYSEGQFITSSLSITMAFILPFIALYLAMSGFGLELKQGLKTMLLWPVKKEKLFLTKVLLFFVTIGALLGIQFIYSMFFSLIFDGFFTFDLLVSAFITYLGAYIALGLVAAVGSLIAMLVSSTGLGLFVAYLGYVGFGVVGLYLPFVKGISPTTLIGQYQVAFSPIRLLSFVLYYIIVLGIGLLLFDRKEEDVCQYELS